MLKKTILTSGGNYFRYALHKSTPYTGRGGFMSINPGKLNKRITLIANKVVDGEVTPQTVTVWAEKIICQENGVLYFLSIWSQSTNSI